MIDPSPGPWRVHEGCGTVIQPQEIRANNGAIVATTYWDRFLMDDSNEPEANARLIAAAPEMLTALQKALPYLRSHISMTAGDDWSGVGDRLAFDSAEAAIAKATGENP